MAHMGPWATDFEYIECISTICHGVAIINFSELRWEPELPDLFVEWQWIYSFTLPIMEKMVSTGDL